MLSQDDRIQALENQVQKLQQALQQMQEQQFITNTELAYQEYEQGDFEKLFLEEFSKQAKQW